MKTVYIIRHANWNLAEDSLTADGIEHAKNKSAELPEFARVYSSPLNRAKQTAELLSEKKPQVDERASIPKAPAEYSKRIAVQRKAHPLGVAGVLFDIPEIRPVLHVAGAALGDLIQQALAEIRDGEQALIVSHDGTMLSAERIVRKEPFDAPLDHTYGELEGFVVDDSTRP